MAPKMSYGSRHLGMISPSLPMSCDTRPSLMCGCRFFRTVAIHTVAILFRLSVGLLLLRLTIFLTSCRVTSRLKVWSLGGCLYSRQGLQRFLGAVSIIRYSYCSRYPGIWSYWRGLGFELTRLRLAIKSYAIVKKRKYTHRI